MAMVNADELRAHRERAAAIPDVRLMRGDMPSAAFRLLNALPCRTHVRKVGDYAGRESVNNFRRVVIDGVLYESLTEAGRQLGKSRGYINDLITSGKARCV